MASTDPVWLWHLWHGAPAVLTQQQQSLTWWQTQPPRGMPQVQQDPRAHRGSQGFRWKDTSQDAALALSSSGMICSGCKPAPLHQCQPTDTIKSRELWAPVHTCGAMARQQRGGSNGNRGQTSRQFSTASLQPTDWRGHICLQEGTVHPNTKG